MLLNHLSSKSSSFFLAFIVQNELVGGLDKYVSIIAMDHEVEISSAFSNR